MHTTVKQIIQPELSTDPELIPYILDVCSYLQPYSSENLKVAIRFYHFME